jgi:hypothetical protein
MPVTSNLNLNLIIVFVPSMVAHWTTSDEAALIDHFVEHKAEAGDGFTFKGATWKAAAVHMVAYTARGDPKTDRVCKNKWARVRAGDLLFLLVLTTTCS